MALADQPTCVSHTDQERYPVQCFQSGRFSRAIELCADMCQDGCTITGAKLIRQLQQLCVSLQCNLQRYKHRLSVVTDRPGPQPVDLDTHQVYMMHTGI